MSVRATWAVEPRDRISGRRWAVLRDGRYLGSAPTEAGAERMMREMMKERGE